MIKKETVTAFVLCTQTSQQALTTHWGPLRSTYAGLAIPDSVSGCYLSPSLLHILLVLRSCISRKELLSEKNTFHFLRFNPPSPQGS